LLELLLLTEWNRKSFDVQYFPHSKDAYYADLLQKLILNQDEILPTRKPRHTSLVDRVHEASFRFEQYRPPLKDSTGQWKKDAIKDRIRGWTVEEVVAEILPGVTMSVT
jgi:hypothetical protein